MSIGERITGNEHTPFLRRTLTPSRTPSLWAHYLERSPVTLAEESAIEGVADVRGPNRVATPQDEEASTYSPNVEPCWEDTPFEAAQS